MFNTPKTNQVEIISNSKESNVFKEKNSNILHDWNMECIYIVTPIQMQSIDLNGIIC